MAATLSSEKGESTALGTAWSASLSAAASELFTAADRVEARITRLHVRCDAAIGNRRAAFESVINACLSSIAASKANAVSRSRYRVLRYDKQSDALESSAKSLTAAARCAMWEGIATADLAASLEALLPLSASNTLPDQSLFIASSPQAVADAANRLHSATRLQVGPSPAKTVCSGPGIRWFLTGSTPSSPSHNIICVDVFDEEGEPLRGLETSDIHVAMEGTAGTTLFSTVSLVGPSSIGVAYEVITSAAHVAKEASVTIRIAVGGEALPCFQIAVCCPFPVDILCPRVPSP